MKKITLFALLLGLLQFSQTLATAQTVQVGWNFTDLNATFDTGTPVNFTVGSMTIGNSFGTVSTPIATTSASSGYTGATGGGNIGNAVNLGALNTASSADYIVTFTPSSGYALQITSFNFGTRSTATGPQAYALYSSVDNYATAIATGSIAANSTWSLKNNSAFNLTGALNTAITLRLYVYGGAGNPGSGTINSRVDDIVISVAASSNPGPSASEVRVETAADGSGTIVPAQGLSVGDSITAYAIARDASHNFISNAPATWSLTGKTGGIVDGDLVPSGDTKSAVFTPHAAGTAVIHTVVASLTSVDSGTQTATSATGAPSVSVSANSSAAANGQTVQFTAATIPGTGPTSTGITVTGDLSAIGGSASQAFTLQSGNTYTNSFIIPANLAGSTNLLNFTVADAQGRTGSNTLSLRIRGNVVIFHDNDTHARVTPHYWSVPKHGPDFPPFELVGGVAYVGAKMLTLVSNDPIGLVLNGGDISEGNPVGDWNGPGYTPGTFGNKTVVDYFTMLDTKLRAIPGRGGRGLDAMVVGNHDIRDFSYISNMLHQTSFPVISINICNHGTHTPYFQPYVIVNVNGNKIGIVGYTTESADSPEAEVNNTIDVVECDWSSTDSTKIHFADYVNELRVTQGCDMVILLTHMGHSGLCTITGANPTPILVDDTTAKLPEIVVSGHWHTFCDTVWQPSSLNYKTIFTEAGSFTHYISELRVNGFGNYITNANYPIKNSLIAPDPDIANYIETRKSEYNAATTNYDVDDVVGYSTTDLLLDNYLKWWSADEYPWSGNNTAGNWICDAVLSKARALFGSCDLSVEAGGGVRSDIPAGAVTYSQIYETFPWPDDVIYRVNMTGQQIYDYFKGQGCDVALSAGWHVTAFDGVPTLITYSNAPISLTGTYTVAINNYMYVHDSVGFTDPSPLTSTALARSALIEYTGQFPSNSPYAAGIERYTLNGEFSGGYRAVVTMMNDADTRTTFDDAFIRFLSATPETLQHRGRAGVPTSFVNEDGSFVTTNRLSEIELYRSYMGFRTNVLKPGDIIETWGKGAFFGGQPEFVDQEGVQADGVEFRIVGHDESLAKPTYVADINTALDDDHKSHYVKLLVQRTGTSAVVDANGTALTVKDVTAFVNKTLPGSNGQFLYLTGVPTSESYGMRFRCDNAIVAAGVVAFPATASVVSTVNPLAPNLTASPITLTATAFVDAHNSFTLTPVADATVSSGNPTTANNSTTLFIQSGSTSFGNERTWLKFDLSTIPSGSVITSAVVQLYCWSPSATTSLPTEVHVSSDSWTEAALTWNTQPALGAVADTQTLLANSANLYYSWDVTASVQSEFAGDKTVSLVAKPVTENAATSVFYKFDSKEFGGTPPLLQVMIQTGAQAGITNVQFFYRYSSDNTNWNAWSPAGNDDTAPYTASFSYPNGYGYYEFYSIASDSAGDVESTPLGAQAFTHYTAAPVYNTAAIVSVSNLFQFYTGTPRPVTVTTVPPGLSYTATYDGSGTAPTLAGTYAVAASVTAPSYSGSASDMLQIMANSAPTNFFILSSGQSCQLKFSAPVGQPYSILFSDDITQPAANWTLLTNGNVSTDPMTIIDPGSTTNAQRFYKIVSP